MDVNHRPHWDEYGVEVAETKDFLASASEPEHLFPFAMLCECHFFLLMKRALNAIRIWPNKIYRHALCQLCRLSCGADYRLNFTNGHLNKESLW
jgi:hypothetical protein